MDLPSVDQITASAAAARAQGYLEDAGRCLSNAARRRNTLTESRKTHATAIVTRRASTDASCRIAQYAYNAAQAAAGAEHHASKACREAKTPLAKKFAREANKSAATAARIALEVASRAYATCAEAITDAEDAECAYEAGTPLWGRLSPDIDLSTPRSTLPTTGLCRLNLE
jgi:hypothetical protein